MTLLRRVTKAIDTIERTPTEHDTAGVNGPFTALRDPTKGTMTQFRRPPQWGWHGFPLGGMGLWETFVASSLGIPHPSGTPHGSPLVASAGLGAEASTVASISDSMTIKDVGACEPGSLQFSERYDKTSANSVAFEPQVSRALLDCWV